VYARQLAVSAPLRRWIYGILPLRAASSVFEPGCGTGRILEEVSVITGAALSGMDVDAGAIEEARRRVPRASFLEGDAERDPLPRSDVVLISHLLGEVDAGELLARLARRLGHGGRIAVLGEYDWSRAQGEGIAALRASLHADGHAMPSGEAILSALAAAGLRTTCHGWTGASPRPPDTVFVEAQTGGPPRTEALFRLPLFWAVASLTV